MLICQGIQFHEHNAVGILCNTKDVSYCKLLILFATHVGNSFFLTIFKYYQSYSGHNILWQSLFFTFIT